MTTPTPQDPYCDGWACFSMPVPEIVGIVVGGIVLCFIILFAWCCVRRQIRKRQDRRDERQLEQALDDWAARATAGVQVEEPPKAFHGTTTLIQVPEPEVCEEPDIPPAYTAPVHQGLSAQFLQHQQPQIRTSTQ